jgi:C-terminal processing protease CtpA/Prc
VQTNEAANVCREVLTTVQERIYDPSLLSNWASRIGACDDVETVSAAITYVNEALKVTGDRFTQLLDASATARGKTMQNAQAAGIGVVFALLKTSDGKLIADKSGLPGIVRDGGGYPLVREVFAGSPASIVGLKSGDILVSLDGVSLKDKSLGEIVNLLSGELGESIIVTYRSGAVTSSSTLIRAVFPDPSIKVKLLSSGVAYLRLEHFIEKDMPQKVAYALMSMQQAKTIVVDLRGNPGGAINNAISVASLFLEQGTVTSIRERLPASALYQTTKYRLTEQSMVLESVVDFPAALSRVEREKPSLTLTPARQVVSARLPYLTAGKTVVLLVDDNSASASELFAAALSENDSAIVIGVSTYGKGIGQAVLPMPGATQLRVTSLRYYTPRGNWLGDAGQTLSKGIEPEYVIWIDQSDWSVVYGSSNDALLSFVDDLVSDCADYKP